MKLNILPYVFLLNAVISFGQPSPSENCNREPTNENTSTEIVVNRRADAAPVEVTLFFEALCPNSRKFIQEQLYPTFIRLQGTGVLKVKLYPYGNANERWNSRQWIYRCQHGKRECDLHLLATCAFNQLPLGKHVPFINCLESNPHFQNGKNCLQEVGGDWSVGYDCYDNTAQGNKLQHEVAKIQNALSPRLTFVPWILVNGYHDDKVQESAQWNMLSHVCDVYSGTKPSACNGV